ncbi:MAG TPA: peptidylprolyl isomerase [Candidatus Binatia bacterium]|nr:peptidylprolyl isomerase [Candidatus Binatia bacterium]
MFAAWRAALLALVLVVPMAAAAAPGQAADEVAARVNGTVISRKMVREVVQALAAQQDQPPDAKQTEQLTRDALDSLVAFELLYQESQRRGVAVTDAEIDADIAQNKSQFADAAAYKQALAARGMSAEDLRRETRKTLAVNRLLEQTAWQHLDASEDDIRIFYEQNREQFQRPAEIRASHILIRAAKTAPDAERATARKTAGELLAQIKQGANFADLARQHSQDPASASKGGDLGFFARGTMQADFEQAAFALQRGAVSDVVQTPYGFHLITVTDARPAGTAALAEVHDEIAAVLRDEMKRHRQDELVAALKKQATVEILPLLKPTEKAKKP